MNQSSTNIPYTQESNFAQHIDNNIATLWQSREEGFIKSCDKTKLYWIKLTSPENRKAVVVVNGRIESVWKYQEIFYELFLRGFDVYAFDHRGQGQSDRLISDREMGYVYDFVDYVEDMERVLKTFQLDSYDKRYLLAHSMGATISTRYLQTHKNHPFHAAAFSAPMYGIDLPFWLQPIAIPVTQILAAFSPKTNYAPGYTAYVAKPFKDNRLSQSEIRYRWFRELYKTKPELKLGGPSVRWVWQALMASKQCIQMTRQIRTPLLILQGGDDRIVSNKSQKTFFNKLRKTNDHCELLPIEGARHELLVEKDCYRNKVLASIFTFFAKH